MEVPVMNRISDFDSGMINCLHNPSSFLSRIGIENVTHDYSFWKLGALILALVATCTSLINRIKFLIIKFKKIKSLASDQPLLNRHLDDDDSGSEDDDDTCSSTSSEVAEEDDPTTSFRYPKAMDEDFCVAGSGCSRLRRRRRIGGDRFSWSDFANGKSVVKLWDGLGLGLDLENSSGSLISIWDLNEDQKISSFFGGRCQIPAASMASPAVVVSASSGMNNSKNVALRVWDARIGCQIPAIFAEWRPQLGKVVGINSGGVEKVYVRDDASGALTVGDMRNVNSPLENLTEADGDTWWDADAVIVSDECVDGSVW